MGPRTFGHLGFTGTSLWCDPDAGVAVDEQRHADGLHRLERGADVGDVSDAMRAAGGGAWLRARGSIRPSG